MNTSSLPLHGPPLHSACDHQEAVPEPGGRETVLCKLRLGACVLQRFRDAVDGRPVVVCADPHGICTDWQTVNAAAPPAEAAAATDPAETGGLS